MDLFNAFAEPKSEVKLEYLTDELEDALQVTQIATTPVQSNLEDEQITEGAPSGRSAGSLYLHCTLLG